MTLYIKPLIPPHYCRGTFNYCVHNTYHFTRSEALRMWKTKNGFKATYGNLLELFVEAGHTPCAEVLCELLRKKSEFLWCLNY